MSDPFQDGASFDLIELPEGVARLLREVGATTLLVAHLRLVHDVAARLLDALLREWPELQVDSEAVLFGAATHDIGKTLHPDELSQPGTLHESNGLRLLIDRGIEDRFARFAETHARWKQGGRRCTFEDLLVALADTCWKGKRSPTLEDLVCRQLLTQIPGEQWEVFATLDDVIDGFAADGDQRLAWQSQYTDCA